MFFPVKKAIVRIGGQTRTIFLMKEETYRGNTTPDVEFQVWEHGKVLESQVSGLVTWALLFESGRLEFYAQKNLVETVYDKNLVRAVRIKWKRCDSKGRVKNEL